MVLNHIIWGRDGTSRHDGLKIHWAMLTSRVGANPTVPTIKYAYVENWHIMMI